MLAAVIMMFMVFIYSGVAVLDLSTHTSMENQNAVQSLKNQYAVESVVNIALWRINACDDSLGNFQQDEVISQYDSTSKELTVTIDRYDKQGGVTVSLQEDTHFNHGLSARQGIDYNGYSLTAENDPREFDFLPEADLPYYFNNAVEVHTESNHTFLSLSDGIHVFVGNNITIKNVTVHGTLVFTGNFISFDKHVTIIADTTIGDPALVFTDPNESFSFHEDNGADRYTINGPIYSEGTLYLRDGDLSGPIVADRIVLESNIDLTDEVSPQFYKWTQGFGSQEDYPNPVHVKKWKTHKNTVG